MSIAEELPFAAALEVQPERVTVRLSGELDLSTQPELTMALRDAVGTGAPLVVIDLRNLAFIDSTGIVALLTAVDEGRKNSHVVEFLRTDGPVDRTLRIAGVESLLPLAA